MASRVAIIVPAYKCERYLHDTLTSIQEQTYVDWQCVVVDDGSPDDGWKIADQFAKVDARFSLVRQQNAGVAAARNAGLGRLSRDAEFVTCMDADDLYLPHALERLVSELDRRGDVVGCHGIGEFIDDMGRSIRPGEFAALGRSRLTCVNGCIEPLSFSADSTFASVLTASTMFPPGLLLTRRHIADSVGPYDVDKVPADDWDMYIRIARRGAVSFINEVILHYRRHSSNQGAGANVPEQCRRVFMKAFYSSDNSVEQRQIARLCWRAKQRDLVALRCSEALRSVRCGQLARAIIAACRVPFIGLRYLRGRPVDGLF